VEDAVVCECAVAVRVRHTCQASKSAPARAERTVTYGVVVVGNFVTLVVDSLLTQRTLGVEIALETLWRRTVLVDNESNNTLTRRHL